MPDNSKPELKKTAPSWRTIVDGIWLDILDDWAASFETSNRGDTALGVWVQDQTTDILDIPFLQPTITGQLSADTIADEFYIEVVDESIFQVGRIIEIANGDNIFYQGLILSNATPGRLDLDKPINHIYASGKVVQESKEDMLVDGSATPQIFSIRPEAGQRGDFVRVIWITTSDSTQDGSTFGSDGPIPRGLTLRVKKADGEYRNIFNWKNNGEFKGRSFDLDYDVNTGNNTRTATGRRTFGGQSKNGVVIRLDGDKGEELQIVIADNLTINNDGGASSNIAMRMYAQGHELQE
jgi:hypothetical protein